MKLYKTCFSHLKICFHNLCTPKDYYPHKSEIFHVIETKPYFSMGIPFITFYIFSKNRFYGTKQLPQNSYGVKLLFHLACETKKIIPETLFTHESLAIRAKAYEILRINNSKLLE